MGTEGGAAADGSPVSTVEGHDEPASRPPGRAGAAGATGRGRRAWWLGLLVPAAILLIAAWVVDLRAVGAALSALSPAILILALLLATADRFMMTYKWRQLVLAGDARLRYSTALRIHYQAAASGRIVPAPLAADVLRGWLATRAGVAEGVVVSSIVLEKLVSLLVSILVALLGLLYLTGRLPPQVNQGAFFVLLGFALCAGLAAIVLVSLSSVHGLGARLSRRWLRFGPLTRRFGAAMGKVSAAFLHYRSRRGALVLNGLLGVGEYGLQLTKLLVLAIGVGIGLPALTFMAVASVMLFVRRLSGTMESWGLGEGSAVVVFVLLGVEAELAVALLVANFAVSTVAVLPGALLFYTSQRPPQAEEAQQRQQGEQ